MLKVQHFAHFVLAERQTWILQRDLPMNNLHTCQPVRANDFPVAIAVVESSSYSWLVVKPLNFWGPYLVCSSVMGWAHKPDAICVGQTFISLGGDLQYCWCSLPAAFGQAWDSKSRNFPPFPVRVWWSYCWVHQLERQMRVRWRHWRNVAVSTRTVGAPRACFFGGTPMGLIWIYDDLRWFMLIYDLQTTAQDPREPTSRHFSSHSFPAGLDTTSQKVEGGHWPRRSLRLRCAQVYIKFPDGIGIYEVQQCTSRTCDQAGTAQMCRMTASSTLWLVSHKMSMWEETFAVCWWWWWLWWRRRWWWFYMYMYM